MRRRTGPVQQWVDSIPLPIKSDVVNASECAECIPDKVLIPTKPKDIPYTNETKLPTMTVSAPINVPSSPVINTPVFPSSLPHHKLARDPSFQSDSSHCSSVESLLELRKADPAAILLDLGFGGCSASPQESGPLSRIPKRFLQPSTLKGIVINDFVKQQQQTSESFDSVSLGYRGLTGSPYVAPSEIVQKIMDRLRERENHETCTNTILNSGEQCNLLPQNDKFSVLSPDNRLFLEQSRSKSPDVSNKRMIIGQKSFLFGYDGNLIEISSNNTKLACNNTINGHDSASNTNEFTELKQSLEENVILENSYYSKIDKKIVKKLSFDNAIEFPITDPLLEDNRETLPDSSNIAQNNTSINNSKLKEDAPNISQKCETYESRQYYPDIRRASDGSCETRSVKDKESFDEGRRFSDGAMLTFTNRSSECTLQQKRKSFKRQSRVRDTNTMLYCDLSSTESNALDITVESTVKDTREKSNDIINSIHQLNAPKMFKPTKEKDDLKSNTNPLSWSEKSNCIFPTERINDPAEKIEHLEVKEVEEDLASDHSCTEDNQTCCYKGKVCKSCKYIAKKKCWKKMEKIMQENKRLEDMLARNRREMAEIRDMLSSVLSVRMEPGF